MTGHEEKPYNDPCIIAIKVPRIRSGSVVDMDDCTSSDADDEEHHRVFCSCFVTAISRYRMALLFRISTRRIFASMDDGLPSISAYPGISGTPEMDATAHGLMP